MSPVWLAQLPPDDLLLLRILKKIDAASTLRKLFFTCKWMKGLLEENKMGLTHLVGQLKLANNALYISNDFLTLELGEGQSFSQIETLDQLELLKGMRFASLDCGYSDYKDRNNKALAIESMWKSLLPLSKSFNELAVSFDLLALPQPPKEHEENARTILDLVKPRKLVVNSMDFLSPSLVQNSGINGNHPEESVTPWFSKNDDVVLLFRSFGAERVIVSRHLLDQRNVRFMITQSIGDGDLFRIIRKFCGNIGEPKVLRLTSFELLLCKPTYCSKESAPHENALNWLTHMETGAIHTERDCNFIEETFSLERSVLFLSRALEYFIIYQYYDKERARKKVYCCLYN